MAKATVEAGEDGRTGRWVILGWTFGVVSPLLCLALDPFVFRSRGNLSLGVGLLQPVALFSYVLTGMAVASLVGVLLRRVRGPTVRGILLVGAIFATLMALSLVPLALLTTPVAVQMIVFMGETQFLLLPLGFTPALTAIVYWGFFRRLRSGPAAQQRLKLISGAAIAIAVPIAAQTAVSAVASDALRRVVASPETIATSDRHLLRIVAFTTTFIPLVVSYEGSSDPARRAALSAVYSELTGRDIEDALDS